MDGKVIIDEVSMVDWSSSNKDFSSVAIVGGSGKCFWCDAYDLAGLKLTEAQKKMIERLGIDVDILIKAMTGDSQRKLLEELADDLQNKTINFENINNKKTKNWNRKRFYE